MRTMFCFILLFASHPAVDLRGQATIVEHIDSKPNSEIDKWTGSSLGIRMELENGQPTVTDIYSHVTDSSPFQKGDILISLGELRFPDSRLEEIGKLLGKTDPESELEAVVSRQEVEVHLNVMTFRQEFVDIQAICRRLHKNRIIEKHLAATKRDDLIDEFSQRMAIAVRHSKSPREAAEALNGIIDEIGVSHTAIIPASAGLAFSSRAKGSIGIVLQRHVFEDHRGYFVVDKKPGSPSCQSNLKIGDEILVINGVPIEQSRRLDLSGHEDRHQLFAIQANIGEELDIEFLSSPFEESRSVVIQSAKDPTSVDSLRASAKTMEFSDKKIGYVRFWNLMSMGVGTEFSKKTKNEFSECDAIIMDLRGRGGIIPAVLSLNRIASKLEKPVVVIIDGLTRSAKEMLAYLLKKHEHVLVVGMKTTGAVTGATMVKLPSGNSLMIPVASADSLKQFVDGVIIEGVGVEPDEKVDYFVPYSGGIDRILNVALQRAAELANARESGKGS